MQIAKYIIFFGITITFVGIIFFIIEKLGIPFSKIPGDIVIKKEKFSFYFPIVTCLLISIFLTLLFNFIFWLLKK